MFDSLFLELEGDQSWLLGAMQSSFLMKDTYAAARGGREGSLITPAREQRCRYGCGATCEVSGCAWGVQPSARPANLLADVCWCPVLRQVKLSGMMC